VIGVVGAGVIGSGVAQSLAQATHDVVLVDTSDQALDRARADIAAAVRLQRLVAAGQDGGDPAEVLGRISFRQDHDALAGAGFVIENVTERWSVKEDLYRLLDRICQPECVFVVNTSCFPITEVAGLTSRPAQVIGLHFMNPVPLKPVVELIPGRHTAPATVEAAQSLLATMGKTWISVRDSPGFVSNRVLMLTINEAIYCVSEDLAPAASIDDLFRRCFGQKMGPLETADLIGLDTILNSLEVLHERMGDPKFQPCPLLRRMVADGLLGRKSGKGFHRYG
jgi:3-hydroxybutyryl-CoA dehydrogenase